MIYTIHSVASQTALDLTSETWQRAEVVTVGQFRPESNAHHPRTYVRLLHDNHAVHGLFEVHDQFVLSTRTAYGSEVWKDACVEFFVEPKPGRGYFNFEFNCGGAFLCNHIVDPTRTADGFKQATRIPEPAMRGVTVQSTLPRVVSPERVEAVVWRLRFSIPVSVMEAYVGDLGELSGQTWRGNFFKCAEDNSHPHWASWSPVTAFNFHLPECFGELKLA
jgi:hypothetical protein